MIISMFPSSPPQIQITVGTDPIHRIIEKENVNYGLDQMCSSLVFKVFFVSLSVKVPLPV